MDANRSESAWNPDHYLRFGDQRTRPSHDLCRQVDLAAPRTVIDIGCGPGNSTQVLWNRWPHAQVIGLDRSAEMIAEARLKFPDRQWRQGDAENPLSWGEKPPVDLIFSNAALQWIKSHDELVPRLFHQVSVGGALAFQIPCNRYAAIRLHMDEVADDARWRSRMEGPKGSLTMEEPGFYYDVLEPIASKLDIWLTEYLHEMESREAIIDFISSTGLRPYLDALADESERRQFVGLLRTRVEESYPVHDNGKVLYPFRRLFVIAYR